MLRAAKQGENNEYGKHYCRNRTLRKKKYALRARRAGEQCSMRGEIEEPGRTADTNNHVHTTYSFSPYSPAAAVYYAYRSGIMHGGYR